MTEPRSTDQDRSVGSPSELAEPYRSPADHSWNLQMLLDITRSVSRIEERTDGMNRRMDSIHEEVKSRVGRTEFWVGVSISVAAVIALVGIYVTAVVVPVLSQIKISITREGPPQGGDILSLPENPPRPSR